MNHPSPIIAPFHTVFPHMLSGTQKIPTIDQYNALFRGRGPQRTTHFTTTNFYKHLQDQALKGNCQSWYWLFFRLPPLLFSLTPKGGHHSQHMTPVLNMNNGQILRQAFLQAFQEKVYAIPPSTILKPAEQGLGKLLSYSKDTPLEDIGMIHWLTEMYRFNFERYGSPKDKESPGNYNEWQMLKEAFYKELIYPVLQMYSECIGLSDLYCSHPEVMFETENDTTSDLPQFSFDYMIYEKLTKREILPVVCLDLLNWHSDKFAKPEQRMIPTDIDTIRFDNTAKFRQIKRYLLQGRAKSVLVTDFESALLVRIAYDVAPVWNFKSMDLETLPLAVRFIAGLDLEIPLRLAIFCCIEFEYSEENKQAEKIVVQFTRARRAYGCWNYLRTPAFQWHKVTTGRYFQEVEHSYHLMQCQRITSTFMPPPPVRPLLPGLNHPTVLSLSTPMVYPVLIPSTNPMMMLPHVTPK